MGRLRLSAITAFTLVAAAAPAGAAEITEVASRGEPGNPFQLHIAIRWDRLQERAQITREREAAGADEDELRYTRTRNAIVPRIAVAIAEDLDFHFEIPYVLGDDRSWRFGTRENAPTGGVPSYVSSIENNVIDAEGNVAGACASALGCPLFPVAPTTTVYHGGRAGDLTAGVSWGIFNDQKDRTKPYWLVGLDVTFPTAALYEPALDRGTGWSSPYDVPGKPGPFGEKVWKWDFFTVLSRRLGPIDPYVKAHATLMSKSSSTYTNCRYADQLSTLSSSNPVRQMTQQGAINCKDSSWSDAAGAQLPWIAGLTFGTEFVPYEDAAEQQKVTLDLRLWADYTSSQRFYNELTDANGKLNWTEDYLTAGAFAGLYLRASKYVSLQATASLSTMTSHYITGESLGKDGSNPTLAAIAADPTLLNPNFDWRYDPAGRRFRLSEVALFELNFAGVLKF